MSEFYLFDIGSRYRVPERWNKLAKEIYVVGFEPDQEECTRLNSMAKRTLFLSEKHYPIALSAQNGKRRFYKTHSPANSGFYEPIKKTYVQYEGNHNRIDVCETILIHTRSLESFCKENNLWPTFIKIDTQGAEFDILSTFQGLDNVLGIEIELQVMQLFEDEFTNFTHPQMLLQNSGFELWWISSQYWKMKQGGYKRIAWFDALYINKNTFNDPRMATVLKAYKREIGP